MSKPCPLCDYFEGHHAVCPYGGQTTTLSTQIMNANQTPPDHIGDANKMVSTMPERIWAHPSYTWLNIQEISQTEYIRADVHQNAVTSVAVLEKKWSDYCDKYDNMMAVWKDEKADVAARCGYPWEFGTGLEPWVAADKLMAKYNQSLLAQSVLREALNECREMMRNLHGWYPKPDELWKILEPVQGTVASALSTTTPPTDRIVVTREMVEKWECHCVGTGKLLQCPRCQLLAQFHSEQTTKSKGE